MSLQPRDEANLMWTFLDNTCIAKRLEDLKAKLCWATAWRGETGSLSLEIAKPHRHTQTQLAVALGDPGGQQCDEYFLDAGAQPQMRGIDVYQRTFGTGHSLAGMGTAAVPEGR